MRKVVVFAAVSVLSVAPSFGEELSCAAILHYAIDAPIPAELIRGHEVVSFAYVQSSLGLLADHVASAAIPGIPGAYVGLGDSVRRCIAEGCDGFVYVVSNGMGAVGRLIRIDASSTLAVWRIGPEVPHDPPYIWAFMDHGVTFWDVTFADIYASSFRYSIAWAGIDAPTDPQEWFRRSGGAQMVIPWHTMSERPLSGDYECGGR